MNKKIATSKSCLIIKEKNSEFSILCSNKYIILCANIGVRKAVLKTLTKLILIQVLVLVLVKTLKIKLDSR